MLLSMDLLQHLQVGCCWLPTYPSLAIVGVVNSRQLLQLGARDRLMVLHLQASLNCWRQFEVARGSSHACRAQRMALKLQQTSHHS